MNLSGVSQFNQARIEWAIRLRYSPMPELDMGLLASQLNAFRIGELRIVGKTWEVMMERDGELAVNADKRYSDLSRLEWKIVSDGSSDGDRHAAALQYLYDHCRATAALDQDVCGDVSMLIYQVATAIGNYYSTHEMLLRIDNAAQKEVTYEFRHTPIWFFESRRGYLAYLKHIFDVYGQPCVAGEWLTAVGQGWMRPLSMAFAMKHFPLRDWLVFCTRYGSGFLEGITDAPKDSEEWTQAEEALAALANDGVVLHNNGVSFKFLEQPAKNALPFQPIVEMIDRLYAKCFRGVDLATGSRGTNASTGQQGAANPVGASVQAEESGVLQQRDVKWINGIFNERIDRPAIAYLFNQEPRAKFKLIPPGEDDATDDINTGKAIFSFNLPLKVDEVYNRLRWTKPQPGDEVTVPVQQPQLDGEGKPIRTDARESHPFLAGQPPEKKPDTPTAPATLKEGTPIAPGADPARNPQTPSPNMPTPQVDAGAGFSRMAWSRLTMPSDPQTLVIPSLGYAVPNESELARRMAVAAHETILPALKRLRAIANIEDPELLRSALEKFLKDEPQIAAALKHDPSLRKVLEPKLAAEFTHALT